MISFFFISSKLFVRLQHHFIIWLSCLLPCQSYFALFLHLLGSFPLSVYIISVAEIELEHPVTTSHFELIIFF